MTTLELDMASALATARAMGATGWAAAEMLVALAAGMAAGVASLRG
jgi:hypothetical protein